MSNIHYMMSTLSQVTEIYDLLNKMQDLSEDLNNRFDDLKSRENVQPGTITAIEQELIVRVVQLNDMARGVQD